MKGTQQVKNLMKERSGGVKPKNKSTTERLDKLEADIARIIEMLIIMHQTRQNDNEDIKYYVKCVSDLTLNNHEIKKMLADDSIYVQHTSRVHEAIAKSIEGKIDGFLERVNLSNKDTRPDNSITLLIYDVIDEWYSDLDYAALESGVIGVVTVTPKDISILKEMIRDTLVGTFHSND